MRVAPKTRVITEMRTPRSRTSAAFSANCTSSSSRRPNSLSSMAPPTLNLSVIELPKSALPCICSRVSPASRLPTHREANSSNGNVARHSRVTCQLRASIAIPTTTTLIMFDTVLDSVEVNARWAPMTSLFNRDTSAPVCVRVKNASDIRCTCANTVVRRSKIRPSPMREDNQPMLNASPASSTATPAARIDSTTTSSVSSLRMPSSTMFRTRRGVTTTRAASRTVSARKTVMAARCGRANLTTRATVSRPSFCSVMLRSVRMCRHTGPIPECIDIRSPLLCPACCPGSSTHQCGQVTEPSYLRLSLGEPLLVEVETGGALEQGLRLGHGAVDRCGQCCHQVLHRPLELLGGDDGGRQPDVVRLVRVHPTGGGTDLQCPRVANKLDERFCSRQVRHESEDGLAHGEPGVLRDHTQVARERELEAGPD